MTDTLTVAASPALTERPTVSIRWLKCPAPPHYAGISIDGKIMVLQQAWLIGSGAGQTIEWRDVEVVIEPAEEKKA